MLILILGLHQFIVHSHIIYNDRCQLFQIAFLIYQFRHVIIVLLISNSVCWFLIHWLEYKKCRNFISVTKKRASILSMLIKCWFSTFLHEILFFISMNFGIMNLRKINFVIFLKFCNICSYSIFVNVRLIIWFLGLRFMNIVILL